MSPEFITTPTPPDVLQDLRHYEELTEKILSDYFPQGVWFGSWLRSPRYTIQSVNGLTIALISPEGGSPAQAFLRGRDIYVTSLTNGREPIIVRNLRPCGDWRGECLMVTHLNKPVHSPAFRNGTGLQPVAVACGPIELAGFFVNCEGKQSSTVRRKGFVVTT